MSGARRLPRTLFGGRIRTSTALLGATFIGVLLLWYAVRPEPDTFTEEVVRVRTTRVTESKTERSKPAPVERAPAVVEKPVVPSQTPTSTPKATPKPKRTPSVAPTAPIATPGSSAPPPGILAPDQPDEEAPPEDTPTPAETPPPRKPGLFDSVPGARAPERNPATTPAESAEPVDAETPSAQR